MFSNGEGLDVQRKVITLVSRLRRLLTVQLGGSKILLVYSKTGPLARLLTLY